MCEEPQKSQVGPTGRRTVLQLKPISYQIQLVSLGARRIARDDEHYRCRFALAPEGSSEDEDPGHVLPNVVSGEEVEEAAARAASPRDADGTQGGVPGDGDVAYRILVTDHHGVRAAENLTLVGPDGNTHSMPGYYEEQGWLPDVSPAVPFRVVVRRFCGSRPVDLPEDLVEVVVEVKDPPEEQNGRDDGETPWDYLRRFFARHNRERTDPTGGDDNAVTWFAGLRPPSAAIAGVKAPEVLKLSPYHEPPVAGEVCAEGDVVDFGDLDLPDACGEGGMDARFPLEVVTDPATEVQVGVAEFAFCPPPVGGDNYRLLITLRAEEEDLRERRENGAAVRVVDHDRETIPAPRGYLSPRLTYWRRIPFHIMVRVNEIPDSALDWNRIKEMYRKCFVEIVEPEISHALSRAEWTRILRSMFHGVSGIDEDSHFEESVFRDRLFPDLVMPREADGSVGRIDVRRANEFAREAINLACRARSRPSPLEGDGRSRQNDGYGPSFVLVRRARTRFGGYSMGDRTFWSEIATPDFNTTTAAHELGHIRSLRHAHIDRDRVRYAAAGASAPARVFLVNPNRGGFPMDHDGQDAFHCLMSYTCSRATAEPCGHCALTLRFYDRTEIHRQNRDRGEMIRRYGPATVATYRAGATGVPTVTEVSGDLTLRAADHETVEIMVLGPEKPFEDYGTPERGRANITWVCRSEDPSPGIWQHTPEGHLRVRTVDSGATFERLRLEALSAGTTVLTYRQGRDPTARLTVNVV